MGCFKIMCNLSNIQICEGDKARAIIMLPGRKEDASLVYSNDLCNPCFLPIKGVYNDYGTLERITEDAATKRIAHYLQARQEVRDIVVGERADKKNPKTIKDWLSAIACGAVTLKEYDHARNQPTKTLMVSLCLEAMWKPFKLTVDSDGSQELSFRREADKWFQWYCQLVAQIPKDKDDTSHHYWYGSGWGSRAIYPSIKKGAPILPTLETNSKCGLNEFLKLVSSEWGYGSSRIQPYWFAEVYFESGLRKLFDEGNLTIDSPEWISFRDAVADAYVIFNAMDVHHRPWLPSVYGCQEHCRKEQISFLEAQLAYLKEKEAEWEHEYEE